MFFTSIRICKKYFRAICMWHLKETAGGHTIKNGKMFKTNLEDRKEKCEPCNTNKPSKCCKLVIETSTFRSYYTQQLLHYISKAQL